MHSSSQRLGRRSKHSTSNQGRNLNPCTSQNKCPSKTFSKITGLSLYVKQNPTPADNQQTAHLYAGCHQILQHRRVLLEVHSDFPTGYRAPSAHHRLQHAARAQRRLPRAPLHAILQGRGQKCAVQVACQGNHARTRMGCTSGFCGGLRSRERRCASPCWGVEAPRLWVN